jgi:hypothetical protein
MEPRPRDLHQQRDDRENKTDARGFTSAPNER